MNPPPWIKVLLHWIGFTVLWGLLLAVGARALISVGQGIPLSRLDLTGHGELLPGAVILSINGLRHLLLKPDNTGDWEREKVGLGCALVAVSSALWLGSILTLAVEKLSYSGPNVANGSLFFYMAAFLVGGYSVVRSDRT